MLKKLFSLVLILSFFTFCFRAEANTKALAQYSDAYVRLVRSMSVDETGVSNPAGIAFSTRSNHFHVVGENVQPASRDIIQLDRVAKWSGSARIAAAGEDPINIAFDNQTGQLLSYQAKSGMLDEIGQDSGGGLDPASLVSHDVRRLKLESPHGMSVDEASGDLFILDQGGPRIVRIGLGSAASLDTASFSEVDLSAVGTADLRGLAVDPSTGHFFVVSPDEQRLYELTRAGEVEAVRDLSEFGLVNPQGMVFAPSGDQTDDPATMSLYLADSGDPNTQTSGRIVELSLIQPAALAEASFVSVLVNTVDLSLIDPPSPDTTGLAYLSSSDHLLITDSDVEETVSGITHYEGVNVWELTLGGDVVYTTTVSTLLPTLVAMTDEPTGVAWKPSNNFYYFTDDKQGKVFELDPGLDTFLGTADDDFTSFSVLGAGSYDAEGITYDSVHDRLFVVDGTNAEVYQFSTTGTLLGQFDVARYGVLAPQSVEFNSLSGTLFVMEDGSNHSIIETTLNGLLLRSIDYSAALTVDPGGLAYAPGSAAPGEHHFYIVDRGIDNNTDPNIIDGKMFELTAPDPITTGNLPPVVDAGTNQAITLPLNSVSLDGTVTDDGLPTPPTLTTLWSKLSGPCTVTFGNVHAVDTTASFPYTGRYLLQLDASDGELNAWDTVTVDVNRPANTKVFDIHLETKTDDAEEALNGGMIKLDTHLELGTKNSLAQKVGLRFNWVGIPHGATILNAYIQFSAITTGSNPTSLTIRGQAADNPGTFTGADGDITNRVTTTASVPWSPPAWNTPGEQGIAQRTPNLAPVIQEVTNRAGWVSGNSMVFIITGTGERDAQSYDFDPCKAAVLHIEYDTPPVAVNNAYSVNEDTTLNVTAPGVLGNDSDGDLDPLTAVKVTDPAHGSVTLNANGSFSYTPAANYFGSDSFTYRANDGTLNSTDATVTITVNSVNDPPVADVGGPYLGTVGLPIQFDGTGSSDIDGTITSYQWNFGDGHTGTGPTPTHTYDSPDDYTVTLTVTDNGALTDNDQTTVTVANAFIYVPLIAR
jgi:VCBS repeat-containing protein